MTIKDMKEQCLSKDQGPIPVVSLFYPDLFQSFVVCLFAVGSKTKSFVSITSTDPSMCGGERSEWQKEKL